MVKLFYIAIGWGALAGVMSFSCLSIYAQAQSSQEIPAGQTTQPEPETRQRPAQNEFEGRGVAHAPVFTTGRNVHTSLTVKQGRFIYNMATQRAIAGLKCLIRESFPVTVDRLLLTAALSFWDWSSFNLSLASGRRQRAKET